MGDRVREAQGILSAIGLQKPQCNRRSALTLLALAGIRKSDDWSNARARSMSVVGNQRNPKYPGIIRFIREEYGTKYAENSRESIRRATLHQFVQAGILIANPDNPKLPTNSQLSHYRLSDEMLDLIKTYGSQEWESALRKFQSRFERLGHKYTHRRELHKLSLTLPDQSVISLSPGKHNELQVAIINEFVPRFARGAELVYIGDTAKKKLFRNDSLLAELGITLDEHGKMPDVILFSREKKWLYLIEAVTSHGPISAKRLIELEALVQSAEAKPIYVTALPNAAIFRKHAAAIAWETEVWLMDSPDHLIHFNGSKFLGPY